MIIGLGGTISGIFLSMEIRLGWIDPSNTGDSDGTRLLSELAFLKPVVDFKKVQFEEFGKFFFRIGQVRIIHFPDMHSGNLANTDTPGIVS